MPRKVSSLPKARRFAVVRMDPVAMVEHLRDPLATEAAKALQTEKYLVYLEFPQDLPMPDSEYCRYRVNVVAPSLRPAVRDKGITTDMVIPIYPNTQHARPGTQVTSSPTFPFSNCYFWIDGRLSLRVRVSRDHGYDNDRAYQLSIPQHLTLSDAFEHDFARINRFWCQRRTTYAEEVVVGASTSTTLGTPPDVFFASVSSALYTEESALLDDYGSSPDSSPERDSSPSGMPPIPPSISDLLSMNLFGWDDDPSFQFIPLVDLWLDLEAHLTEVSIPNPVGLWKEQERVGMIIRDSMERRTRAEMERSLRSLRHFERSRALRDPGASDRRGAKAQSRGRDERRRPQEKQSSTVNQSTTQRPVPAPTQPPPSTITQEYRSWSGDIHHQEAVALPAPPAESGVEKIDQLHNASARSAESLVCAASPVPSYRPHASPMTPPPSYASLLKDAGAPAPRSPGSSRAAVWPSRHPSPVLREAAAMSVHQQRSAAESRRRAIKEARRAEERERTGRPPRSHRGRGSIPSSRPHTVVHANSFSYVQETVIQGSTRDSTSDPWTSPEEGWLPVKERVVPSQGRSQSRRSGVKDRQASSGQLAQLMQTGMQLSRDMSRLEAFRVDDGRKPARAGQSIASSTNARHGGATLRPW